MTIASTLERLQQAGCPNCSGDCGAANPPVASCIMDEIASALQIVENMRKIANQGFPRSHEALIGDITAIQILLECDT